MKRQVLTAVLAVVFGYCSFAQSLHNQGKVELGFQGINLGYEALLNERITLDAQIGLGGGNYNRSSELGYQFNVAEPRMFAQGTLKWNYNYEKFDNKEFNSSNYVAYQLRYTADNENEINHNSAMVNEIHWGVQRQLGESNFIWSTHAGLGFITDFDFEESGFMPTLGLKIGYVLF